MKILHLDDDMSILDLIGALISRDGHEVISVCDPIEAARHAPDVDLIITDYDMPMVNGVEFTKMMRESGLTIPIYMLSGSLSAERPFMDVLGTRFFNKIDLREFIDHVLEVGKSSGQK